MGLVLITWVALFGLSVNAHNAGAELNNLDDAKVFLQEQLDDNRGVQYDRLND